MPMRASGGLTQVRMGSSPCCETRNSLVKCGWSVRPHSATISFSAQSVDGTRPFDYPNQADGRLAGRARRLPAATGLDSLERAC